MMDLLLPRAQAAAAILRQRKQTIAIGESSAGGLITAALLAVPGASEYFLGGNVLYTRRAWYTLKDFDKTVFEHVRPATEENALIRAQVIRKCFGSDWSVAETGAAGPTGNHYGDPAGHSCFAVAGAVERARTLEAGNTDRLGNMYAFAAAALD